MSIRTRRLGAAVAILSIAGIVTTQQAAGQDQYGTIRLKQIVRSFDGTPIIVNVMPARDLQPGVKAPTVISSPGWAFPGDTQYDATTPATSIGIAIGDLRERGYNVVTIDPRGHGGSGGQAHVNSRDYEGRDMLAVIDYVATLPEAQLDGLNDPRIGLYGPSYGGAASLNGAALDSRVDAIVPTVTYHDLERTLSRGGPLLTGWGNFLCVAGNAMGFGLGLFSPAGIQLGALAPEVNQMCAGVALNLATPSTRAMLDSRGIDQVTNQIHAPAMFVQGTTDTLFPLIEATDNYTDLRDNGTTTKLVWVCGGHASCNQNPGTTNRVPELILRWFDKYLKDLPVQTGQGFEYIDQLGNWYHSPTYPPTSIGTLGSNTKGGLLPVNPLDSSGTPTSASPHWPAVEAQVNAVSAPVMAVGAPVVTVTYRGLMLQPGTYVYAQLVSGDRVIGRQATAVPIKLDGARHTIQVPMELISHLVEPGATIKVQLFSRSLMFQPQTALGTILVESLKVSLPLVNASPM